MITVAQLLNDKHRRASHDAGGRRSGPVYTIGEGDSVLGAARLMNEYRIGALIVTDTLGRTAGIITERDILTRVVSAQLDPAATAVSKVMTAEIITCSPQTHLDEARQMMTDRKIRHIPVIDTGASSRGSLAGMISIGDLNAAVNADLSIEVESMRQYIIAG